MNILYAFYFLVTIKYKKTYSYIKSDFLEVVSLLFDFSIIGGDDRLSYMANNLSDMNFSVVTYKTTSKINDQKIKQATSIKDAVITSKNIICPIPLTRDGISITNKLKICNLSILELQNNLNSSQNFFAGCIPKEFVKFTNEKNIFIYDYMQNNSFSIYNSIATAEAAIAEAILNNSINMHSSNCLVLGFGKCGKLIAHKLKNLCKTVTICARNENDRAFANAYGYESFNLNKLKTNINNFQYIFNTIPAMILNKEIIGNISKNSFILDITPIGTDINACKEKSINAKISLAIPGKFKAKSSAEALINITLKILKKTKKI